MIDLVNDYGISELKARVIKTFVAEGVTREPWGFKRGAKTERLYKSDGQNIIRVFYTSLYSNGYRDVASLNEFIEYFDSEGNIFLTIPLNKQYSIKGLAAINREIRQGRVDYLTEAGKQLSYLAPLMPEPWKTQFPLAAAAVPAIMLKYHDEIQDYISVPGSMSFENAVNNETDETTLTEFTYLTRPPDAEFPTGLNVKQSILHQLTGEVPA